MMEFSPDSRFAGLPRALRACVELAYPVPGRTVAGETPLYAKGPLDFYYVAFWAVAFTALRYGLMNHVLSPLARAIIPTPKVEGSMSAQQKARIVARRQAHNVTRFAEQAWGMLYCTVFWTLGLVILSRIPDALSPAQLWGTYPYTPIPALTKFYYLAQLGWWWHQVLVINFEKRRKDYWQMFGHHIISICLIVGSYKANYTRIGIVVHTLMDLCDILLPAAKLLRYLNLTTACDGAFVLFLLAWIATRQIGLSLVIRSAYVEAPKYIADVWAPEQGHYFSQGIVVGFVALLSVLLVLCSIWFYMAIMVAVRVVRGQGAEDSRSDSEDSVDEDEVMTNGTNGASNGTSNGRTNGYANGVTNGSANGTARRRK